MRLTQPALSRQIKALKEEPDTALLERGAHSIHLTRAGEVLMSEARKLDRGDKERLITRPLIEEPSRIEEAAGVPTDSVTSAQTLAFIEELKNAAGES